MSGSSTAEVAIEGTPGAARATGGGVRLREDAPLKCGAVGSAAGQGQGGLRGVCVCFAVLSVGVAGALLVQGGGPGNAGHGAVAGEGPRCAEGGAAVLRAGGGALRAAAVAMLCAIVQAPHRAGLLAPGRLLRWQYTKRAPPRTASWPQGAGTAALHRLHSRDSPGPDWRALLQPAVDLASEGFPVSRSLAWWAREAAGTWHTDDPEPVSRELADLAAAGALLEGATVRRPVLAAHLRALQNVSDDEWAASWNSTWLVEGDEAAEELPGGWQLYGAGEGLGASLRALLGGRELPADRDSFGGAGVAVVAPGGDYAVLAVGGSAAGCVLVQEGQRCGERYIAAGGGSGALLRVAARLVRGGGVVSLAGAVEAPRVEGEAVNLVRQRGDELAAHADSRGLGVAARF